MNKIALLAVALLTAIGASATPVDYHFSYTMGSGLVSGELDTVDQGNGSYLVTGASGSYLGSAITGVFDPGLSGNTFSFNNLLYFPGFPNVDLGGIVFQINGDPNIATGINLYWDGVGYRSIDGGNNGPYVKLSINPADSNPTAPTPEPGTLVLLASGILGGAGILRRRLGTTAR